ncbi:MIP/aquaporin family protein [Spiroplasma diminutum]|uniref:Glycerol uptake facilitator protein n=1 Tax=Spiroplasma diminutum CUAS-1 TaxID=1276221 RepID=S5LWW5_9MOLU|nr:MIP/aquaporin family protein [Spiroplasma diminutum]AGR42274.1 glycerol uptake facilitator protein [Spiroplasma diminutum CUAS-1]
MNIYLTIFISELIGSLIISMIGNGVMANCFLKGTSSESKNSTLQISIGWGLGITLGIVVALMLGGTAHLNFIITLFYLLTNWSSIGPYALFPVYILSQILGFVIGQFLIILLYFVNIKETLKNDLQINYLLCFCTAPNKINKKFNNLYSEFISGIFFLFVFTFIVNNYNGIIDPKTSYIITFMCIVAISVSLGGNTGPSISPTRDLSLRFIHWLLPFKNKGSSNWKYSWIPLTGSTLSSIVISIIWLIIF